MQYHEHVFLYRVLAARTSDGKIGFSLLFARRQPQRAKAASMRAPPPHIRDKLQKPAKNYIRKIREIEWSYLCLQQFDKF